MSQPLPQDSIEDQILQSDQLSMEDASFCLRSACIAYEPEIGPHLKNVSNYAAALARKIDLDPHQIDLLWHGAALHDIGKLGIPQELIRKESSLSPDEMQLMQSHTVIGHNILNTGTSEFLKVAAEIALSHHESWDGTGYPNQIKGNAIPLTARIVAIVDVYDALRSKRRYKPAWGKKEALQEMTDLRGQKFDPELLDLFLTDIPA